MRDRPGLAGLRAVLSIDDGREAKSWVYAQFCLCVGSIGWGKEFAPVLGIILRVMQSIPITEGSAAERIVPRMGRSSM